MRERLRDAVVDFGRIFKANAADPDGFGHRREVRIDKLGAEVEETGRLLLQLDEAERAVVEHDDFHRQVKLLQAQQVAHQHGEPAVAR